jgi:lipopolysaccharide export system protein LptA
MMRSRLLLLAALAAGAPALAAAQQQPGRCRVQLVFANDSGGVLGTSYFASGGVRLRCQGQPVTMDTDSVLAHPNGDVEFHGYMRYRDSTVAIDAQRAYYRKATETWEARGDVLVRDLETGSTMRGPTIDYLRSAAGLRDSSEVYAVGRPRVEYFDTDSAGPEQKEPYIIIGDRLRSRGKALIWAGGRVQIDRSDLSARGDSMMLDTGTRDAGTLIGKPVFRSLGADSFALSGARIDFALQQRRIRSVLASNDAHLLREDWDLVGDTITIDVEEGAVQQIVAWGRRTRSEGKSPRYAVRADSVTFDTPDEVLTQIRAYGDAWVAASPDSGGRERDWLAGDTVVADFAPRPEPDSAGSAQSPQSARHHARSLRHIEPEEPGKEASLAYATGRAITIVMKPGGDEAVERVEIVGQVDGVQLDPGTPRQR